MLGNRKRYKNWETSYGYRSRDIDTGSEQVDFVRTGVWQNMESLKNFQIIISFAMIIFFIIFTVIIIGIVIFIMVNVFKKGGIISTA